jgi:hypothetical protein
MKEFLRILIVLFFSCWVVAGFAQTNLTVTTGTPTMDGVIDAGEWTSGTLTTQGGVTLQAMADGQSLYLLYILQQHGMMLPVQRVLRKTTGASMVTTGHNLKMKIVSPLYGIWDRTEAMVQIVLQCVIHH